MKQLLLKCGPMLASLAILFTAMEEKSFCFVYTYQPELPKEAKRLPKERIRVRATRNKHLEVVTGIINLREE